MASWPSEHSIFLARFFTFFPWSAFCFLCACLFIDQSGLAINPDGVVFPLVLLLFRNSPPVCFRVHTEEAAYFLPVAPRFSVALCFLLFFVVLSFCFRTSELVVPCRNRRGLNNLFDASRSESSVVVSLA